MNSPILVLLILFVLFRFLNSGKEQAKKQQQQQRQKALLEELEQAESPKEARPAATLSPRGKKSAAVPPAAPKGPQAPVSREGRSFGGSLKTEKKEWTAPAAVRLQSADELVTVGGEDIPEDEAYSLKGSEGVSLRLDPQKAREAFLLSEILGKPKARRR